MLPFERLKRIRPSIKDIVYGYVNITHSNITEAIKDVILLFYYQHLESLILTDEECDILSSMFEQANKFKDLGNYSYKKIFNIDKDGDYESLFKEKCHDKSHLLCLIQTVDDDVLGGYTAKGWQGHSENIVHQQDDKAFILNIRSNKNYEPKIFDINNYCHALRVQSNFYCQFGGDGTEVFLGTSYFKTLLYTSSTTNNYKPYPSNNYLTSGKSGFRGIQISKIEVFQLINYSSL